MLILSNSSKQITNPTNIHSYFRPKRDPHLSFFIYQSILISAKRLQQSMPHTSQTSHQPKIHQNSPNFTKIHKSYYSHNKTFEKMMHLKWKTFHLKTKRLEEMSRKLFTSFVNLSRCLMRRYDQHAKQ